MINWETLKTADELASEALENKANQVRAERDKRIKAVEWRVKRYQQQKLLTIETTDSDAVYSEILTYIQALRDITEQSGFPESVTFPTM